MLLGDLHFDRLEHHDMAWVQREKPNDVSQIRNYGRITRDLSPQLLRAVGATIAEHNRSRAPEVAFVLQAGDLVEGLCGSEELSVRQNSEALAFVREAQLGAPFIFTKGNHDITGPGALAAFRNIFHPFLTTQVRAISGAAPEVTSARYTVDRGNAQFVFFDAYEAAASLEWFEGVVQRRTAEHLFVVVHPPVVPYGARSTWHLFGGDKEQGHRRKFLDLLGAQHAIVLGGHIHRYNAISRQAGRGQFAQFALSSVIPAAEVRPANELSGVNDYTPEQVRVEPRFSPETEPARRKVYETELPFVKSFDYADLPGYALVTVAGSKVSLSMYSGISRTLWRTVDLTALAGT